MSFMQISTLLTLIGFIPSTVSGSIWCYSCISNQPGCSEDSVSYLIHGSITCPKDDDKCVKIIEHKDGNTLVTRDCLSKLVAVRTDIPGDKYEGCRSASLNPKLANNVYNDILELNLKRNDYDNITFCFCEFNHLCNGQPTSIPLSNIVMASFVFLSSAIVLVLCKGSDPNT